MVVSLQRQTKKLLQMKENLSIENPVSPLMMTEMQGAIYKVHSALGNFLSAPLYNIHHAIVFSNEREVKEENGITYMPVYYSMFLSKDRQDADGLTLPVLLPPEI